jgi:hypothetical protein
MTYVLKNIKNGKYWCSYDNYDYRFSSNIEDATKFQNSADTYDEYIKINYKTELRKLKLQKIDENNI